MSLEQQRKLEETYVMPTFGRKPVDFVRGEGMRLWDDEGREYLDFLSGIGVISLGHCHPALVKALTDQAMSLMHVSNYYYIEGRGELAEKISNLLNEGASDSEPTPWQTFFANSGAEANECAIKLARLRGRKRAQGKDAAEAPREVVSLMRSFHGRTLATLAATAQPVKQEAFHPLPDGFIATPANDVAALEELFAERGERICGMLIEPIQGESGVHPCTAEFLAAARRLCDEYDALLMFDEVQCGMYRCGTHPFAFQHAGVVPDVVTMAKGIGGGMPMGACAAREDVAGLMEPGLHGSTFGGSNLAVAAANAVIDTIAAEGIARNVEEVGAYLRKRVAELPCVAEVRGMGLMVGAELKEGCDAPGIVSKALEAGVVLNATGPTTLRFLPPLICTRADVDELIERLSVV